ncbi:MAG: AzlC family ABC transporter permease [Chloroflexota bacterium]
MPSEHPGPRSRTIPGAIRDPDAVRASRRRLVTEAAGTAVAATAFGIVYGLAARAAGFSIVEALAMSIIVLAGASQFAAVGFVAQGLPWIAIVLLTFLLNARHLLYSAALAPWLQGRSRAERAAMAHGLTDESFAVSLAHFKRIGWGDARGYWLGAAFIVIPWPIATLVGYLGGEAIPSPQALGLDVVFAATMACLAVAVITGRRELAAAISGAVIAVIAALATSTAIGIVAGGVVGPLVGLLVPHRPTDPSDAAPPSPEGHDEAIGVAP